MSYATFSAHTAYWRSIIFDWGMVNVWANPIFGLGLNDWVRPRYMVSGSMDNFWLVVAVRYGIPGFALLAAGYLIALWKIGRRDFDGDQLLWQFRRAWMFSFIGLTFTRLHRAYLAIDLFLRVLHVRRGHVDADGACRGQRRDSRQRPPRRTTRACVTPTTGAGRSCISACRRHPESRKRIVW